MGNPFLLWNGMDLSLIHIFRTIQEITADLGYVL